MTMFIGQDCCLAAKKLTAKQKEAEAAKNKKAKDAASNKTENVEIKFTGTFYIMEEGKYYVNPTKGTKIEDRIPWSMNFAKANLGKIVVLSDKPDVMDKQEVTVKGVFDFENKGKDQIKFEKVTQAFVVLGKGKEVDEKLAVMAKEKAEKAEKKEEKAKQNKAK